MNFHFSGDFPSQDLRFGICPPPTRSSVALSPSDLPSKFPVSFTTIIRLRTVEAGRTLFFGGNFGLRSPVSPRSTVWCPAFGLMSRPPPFPLSKYLLICTCYSPLVRRSIKLFFFFFGVEVAVRTFFPSKERFSLFSHLPV